MKRRRRLRKLVPDAALIRFGFFASLVVLLWTAVTGVVMVVRPVDGVPATTEAAAPALRGGPALTSR